MNASSSELLLTILIHDNIPTPKPTQTISSFLPSFIHLQDSIPWSEALQDSSVLGSLAVDLGLLALFTMQHTLLAWSPVKQALESVLGVLNRTAYCFTTALALQVQQRSLWQQSDELKYAFLTLLSLPFLTVLDLDALLAACDWRPLPVVSASCTLEYLVTSALLRTALPLLGHHLQHPVDL